MLQKEKAKCYLNKQKKVIKNAKYVWMSSKVTSIFNITGITQTQNDFTWSSTWGQKVFNRPGVAGAVLQSPLSLIHLLSRWSFSQNIFQLLSIPNRKNYGAERDTRFYSLCVQGRFFGKDKQTNAVSFCNIWCFFIGYHKAQLIWFGSTSVDICTALVNRW